MFQDTCTAVKNDVCLAYGENHQWALTFDTQRDLSAALCTITIRLNNTDDAVLHTEQLPIVNKYVQFTLNPRQLEQGIYYYDIWLKDGADFEKPIVQGTITVQQLTTRLQ